MVGRSSFAAAACAAALCACAGPRSAPPASAEAPRGAAARGAGDGAELLARAEASLASGAPAAAEALFARAAEALPDDDRPLVGLARARLAVGDLPGALANADGALARRDSPDARALRARVLARQRRFDVAAPELERALAARPRDAPGWALLAAVQVNRGDRLAAARAFAQVAAVLPPADAAMAVWRELRFVPPDPVQPEESLDRCTRAYTALLEGQPGEALREASNGMRFAPSFEWCGVVRAEALWRSNDAAGAEQVLRWALERYGSAHEALRADAKGLLAELLSGRKDRAGEAAALAREALAARGERAAVLVALARACTASGDGACARDAAARLLALPNLPRALHEQAEEWARGTP